MTEETTPTQAADEAVQAPAEPTTESVTYQDGTEATGPAPLPEQSPAEQAAAEEGQPIDPANVAQPGDIEPQAAAEPSGDLPAPSDEPAAEAPVETPAESETVAETPPGHATPQQLHDIWCAKQIAQGWGFGATFDAANRTDPRLVHFDLLTDEQKAAYA